MEYLFFLRIQVQIFSLLVRASLYLLWNLISKCIPRVEFLLSNTERETPCILIRDFVSDVFGSDGRIVVLTDGFSNWKIFHSQEILKEKKKIKVEIKIKGRLNREFSFENRKASEICVLSRRRRKQKRKKEVFAESKQNK